jgi:predicted HAD superfamily phosphohydrolase YqeG
MKIQETINPSRPHYEKSKTAVVGDRLLTDIHLANLMGWKSYLVKPLEKTTIKKHGIAVYMLRHFENFIVKRSNFPRYNFKAESKAEPKS